MLIDKSTDVNKKSSRRAKSNVTDYLNSDKKSKNTTTGIQKIIHRNDLNDISSDDEIKMMKSIFSSQKVNNKKKSNKINELELHDKLTEEDVSESSSDYEIEKIKHPAGRKKKTDKYIVERKQMLEKIQNILGITETNKVFYLYDIDSNKTKQDKINELKNMIELYFKSKNSAVFMTNGKPVIRPYMSLIRLVFKEMGFRFTVSRTTIYRNDKSIYTSMYTIDNK